MRLSLSAVQNVSRSLNNSLVENTVPQVREHTHDRRSAEQVGTAPIFKKVFNYDEAICYRPQHPFRRQKWHATLDERRENILGRARQIRIQIFTGSNGCFAE